MIPTLLAVLSFTIGAMLGILFYIVVDYYAS